MFVLLVTALTVASKVANWCHVMSVNVVVMVASLLATFCNCKCSPSGTVDK